MGQTQAIQMQQETSRIVQDIESQKLDNNAISTFIYALFIIVAISMVFESFVRSYKDKIYEKKKARESLGDYRKKLLITYAIHLIVVLLIWVVCKFLLKLTTPYIGFLIAITVYLVEIAPLFTIHLRFKKEGKNDTPQ